MPVYVLVNMCMCKCASKQKREVHKPKGLRLDALNYKDLHRPGLPSLPPLPLI